MLGKNIATDVDSVINWFFKQEEMSPKKLQKLLYYAYSWFLTINNNSDTEINNVLFDEKFEAWVHGPVLPSVYQKFKSYEFRKITEWDFNQDDSMDDEVVDVLNQVYSVYGDFTANELESITHQEAPWIKAREGYGPLELCNVKISDKTIFDYYGKRMATV